MDNLSTEKQTFVDYGNPTGNQPAQTRRAGTIEDVSNSQLSCARFNPQGSKIQHNLAWAGCAANSCSVIQGIPGMATGYLPSASGTVGGVPSQA